MPARLRGASRAGLVLSLAAGVAAAAIAAEPPSTTVRVTTAAGAPEESGSPRFGDPARRAIARDEVDDGAAADRSAAARARDDLPYVPGRLIVKLTDDAGARARATVSGLRAGGPEARFGIAALDAVARRHGVRAIRRPFAGREARAAGRAARWAGRARRAPVRAAPPSFENVHVLTLSPYLDMAAVAREFAALPEVVWAEPDAKLELVMTTNDPFLLSSGAWGQSFRDLWGLQKIGAQAAWDVARGAGVVVAVTDTGVDAGHVELTGQMWTNADEIAGNGVDDDGNGFIDDTWGWDVFNDDNDPTDDHGHGTHVAGTIAAKGNNGVGVVGVAWQAQVMAVKAFSAGGSGTLVDGADAVLYAIDNGADVINASWGTSEDSDLLRDAVEAARAAGVVFVAAAGNDTADVSGFFPASYPGAIAVSAFDSTDTIAFFSNFGTGIDVAAPGGGDETPGGVYDPYRSILSLKAAVTDLGMAPGQLVIDGIYLRQAGTSMAAPHVAGAAAVVLSANPGLGVEQVRQALRASADDVAAPGFDIESGYGRINVGAAVLVGVPPEVVIDTPAPGAVVIVNAVDIGGTVAGPGLVGWTVEYGAGDTPSAWTPIANGTAEVLGGPIATWDVSGVPDGRYTVRVTATNGSAYTFEDRAQITLDRLIVTAPQSYTLQRGGGPIAIRGTAYAPGFSSYTVEYRAIEPDLSEGPWTGAGMALTGGGTAPVFDGVLATFDSSVLANGRDLDIRLTASGSAGTFSDTFHHIVVDPSVHAGWPIRVPVQTPFLFMKGGLNVADLDGDGTKEILAAYGDLVYVWRADGTDFPGWPQSVEDGDEATVEYVDMSPAAADLDNDGDLEIAIADGEEIHVWHHDGTPMAGWPIRYLLPDEYYDFEPTDDVTLVDLDGDGTRDIVFPWHHAVGAVRTDGSFLPGWPVRYDTILLSPSMQAALAVGDMTGDGSPEVAFVEHQCCGSTGKDYVHVYDASGALLPGFPHKVSPRPVDDNWPIMADVDGDGRLDVVTNDSRAKKIVAFDAQARRRRLRTKIPSYRERVFTSFGWLRFGSAPEPLSAGDITGDGRAEIFVGTEWPQANVRCSGFTCSWTYLLPPWAGINVFQAVSSTTRQLPGWPQVWSFTRGDNAHGAGSAAIGDIDGDGGQDVVVGTGMCWAASGFEYHRCYPVHAFHANGSALAGFPKPTPFPGGDAGLMPAIGDLDGDGLKEVAWADWAGNVIVWDVPGTPGPENIQWSGFRGNAAHTGARP